MEHKRLTEHPFEVSTSLYEFCLRGFKSAKFLDSLKFEVHLLSNDLLLDQLLRLALQNLGFLLEFLILPLTFLLEFLVASTDFELFHISGDRSYEADILLDDFQGDTELYRSQNVTLFAGF